jgi:hypothetical protein
MDMPQARLKLIERLFHEAATLAGAERSQFLDAQCTGDPQLRQELEQLLKHDSVHTDDFLIGPVGRERGLGGELAVRATLAPVAEEETEKSSLGHHSIPGFEILGELGRGGMGIVYKARQMSLNRLVALKVLKADPALHGEQLARFRAEARALARFHHANVVQVYEVGEHDTWPYYVMEYVEGPSLAAIMHGVPQSPAVSGRLTEVLAAAIDAVHQHGIIHRDLKPANVLLQIANGTSQHENQTAIGNLQSAIPKITDFGIAKDQRAERNWT